MPEESEEACPYCSVCNPATTLSWTNKAWGTFLGLFGYHGSQKTNVKSLQFKCLHCKREYVLLKFNDHEWIENQLDWEAEVRECMIQIFGVMLPREKILQNIVGIALREDKILDVCFKYGKKRVCMSCARRPTKFMGIYLREIIL